jgi:hypothetical protein
MVSHGDFRAANALRNHGIIVIVGGRGEKYEEVFSTVRGILCGRPYLKKKSISRLSLRNSLSKSRTCFTLVKKLLKIIKS